MQDLPGRPAQVLGERDLVVVADHELVADVVGGDGIIQRRVEGIAEAEAAGRVIGAVAEERAGVIVRPRVGVRRVERQSVEGLRFSPDGRLFASMTHRGEIALWDLSTSRCLRRFGGAEEVSIVRPEFQFSADGKVLAIKVPSFWADPEGLMKHLQENQA